MPKVCFVLLIASVRIITYMYRLTLVSAIIAQEAKESIGHRKTSFNLLGAQLKVEIPGNRLSGGGPGGVLGGAWKIMGCPGAVLEGLGGHDGPPRPPKTPLRWAKP